jgi:uncharacterized protein (DUF885 family)
MTDANQGARELADRYWDDLLELEPILGTEVGDERFDDRLPDPTENGRARRQQVQSAALTTIGAVDREALDAVTRTTLDVMEAIATRDLESLQYRFDRFGAVSHLWGPGNLLAEIGSRQRADTPERLDRYLARLRAVPAYLDAMAEVAEEGARLGQVAPALVVDRTIAQIQRLLAIDPADSPALMPVPEASTEGREGVVGIVRAGIAPAYARYLEMLRGYRPVARETIGLSALPGGDEMYAAEVRAWTTLPLAADEVHRIGLEDFERIQHERRECARRLGHEDPAEAVAEYWATGRNVASSRDEMVRLAQAQVERSWEAAPRWFGGMPHANCEVRAIEEFREADMPFAFYQSPTADGSRPGVYYVNTSDLAERPLHHLAATTYHEANPGHHFQVSIEQEIPDRPSIRRFGGILAGSAFIEGWGLYSERLADEMGLYQDEYERMGMLEAQAWRAARLVVDTGIHAFGWTREQSVELMVSGGVPRLDAEIETDRYITMPGQALAYKVGQIEIERWRGEAEKREGAEFDLKGFHDRLLGLGSLPLGALQREIESSTG